MRLYNYQITAAARLREAIQRGGSILFHVPQGAGRSIMVAEACRGIGKVAYLTRHRELAEQMESILKACDVKNVEVIHTGFRFDRWLARQDNMSGYDVVVLSEDLRSTPLEHRCVVRHYSSGGQSIAVNGRSVVDLIDPKLTLGVGQLYVNGQAVGEIRNPQLATAPFVRPRPPRTPLFQLRRGRDYSMPGWMRRLRLTIGARPDLAGEGEHIPVRLAIELNHHIRLSDYIEHGPNARGRWGFRVWTDFHRIERLIAAKWIIGHILARTINRPRPWSQSDYNAAEARMERLAWSADDGRLAAPALARVKAIRIACKAAGFRTLHEW